MSVEINKNLEYRMYGLVPYNIAEIQKGIQYGHSLQELNNMVIDNELDNNPRFLRAFHAWRKKHKTFIILNGGTTNNDTESIWYGTMNQAADYLESIGIVIAKFYEPDLGNQLTGIVFIVDERVFNKKKYLDFIQSALASQPCDNALSDDEYNEWVKTIGGDQNVKLREFLKDKRLA